MRINASPRSVESLRPRSCIGMLALVMGGALLASQSTYAETVGASVGQNQEVSQETRARLPNLSLELPAVTNEFVTLRQRAGVPEDAIWNALESNRAQDLHVAPEFLAESLALTRANVMGQRVRGSTAASAAKMSSITSQAREAELTASVSHGDLPTNSHPPYTRGSFPFTWSSALIEFSPTINIAEQVNSVPVRDLPAAGDIESSPVEASPPATNTDHTLDHEPADRPLGIERHFEAVAMGQSARLSALGALQTDRRARLANLFAPPGKSLAQELNLRQQLMERLSNHLYAQRPRVMGLVLGPPLGGVFQMQEQGQQAPPPPGTRTRPAAFGALGGLTGLAPGPDDPRDTPPPTIYGEEIDPEEPTCRLIIRGFQKMRDVWIRPAGGGRVFKDVQFTVRIGPEYKGWHEKCVLVNFRKGSVRSAEGHGAPSRVKHLGRKVKSIFRNWEIDSTDVDPVYKSKPGRRWTYRLSQDKLSFFARDRPTISRPGIKRDMNFKMCVFDNEFVPKSGKGLNAAALMAEAIHCIDWNAKATWKWRTKLLVVESDDSSHDPATGDGSEEGD